LFCGVLLGIEQALDALSGIPIDDPLSLESTLRLMSQQIELMRQQRQEARMPHIGAMPELY
jgi:hypothetical protein